MMSFGKKFIFWDNTRIFFSALIYLYLAFAMPHPVCAQTSSSNEHKTLSTDEMLDYTLVDLKRQMQRIVEENRKMSGKNQAMRRRIFFLKQQLRDYETAKISILEEALNLTDLSTLALKKIL
jgi:hypothetical protein